MTLKGFILSLLCVFLMFVAVSAKGIVLQVSMTGVLVIVGLYTLMVIWRDKGW